MDRPYIVCHMLVSIDGKVTGDFLSEKSIEKAINRYYEINREYNKDAIALGRVTMEESFTHGYYPSLEKYKGIVVPRKDYVFDANYSFYMIAFDRKGKLGYKTNKIIDDDEGYNNALIIEVLLEEVSDEYLAYLKDKGISYIFAGKKELDIKLALKKLRELFNINKILLEGGSIINGTFLKEDLIDELSLVMVPISAKKHDKSLFYDGKITNYQLSNIQKYDDGSIWLNYKR